MKVYKLYFREKNGEWKYTFATGRSLNAAKKIVANMYYLDVNEVMA